jgi:hypothetical protein
MRGAIILGTVLLLGACHKAPAPPVAMKAGQWKSVTTPISVEGLPKNAPQPTGLGQSTTEYQCFDGGTMPQAMFAKAPSKPKKVATDGNHFTADFEMSDPGMARDAAHPTTSHFDGTFDATHFDATMTLEIYDNPDAPKVTMKGHIVSTYAGPCPVTTNDNVTAPAGDMTVNAAPDMVANATP